MKIGDENLQSRLLDVRVDRETRAVGRRNLQEDEPGCRSTPPHRAYYASTKAAVYGPAGLSGVRERLSGGGWSMLGNTTCGVLAPPPNNVSVGHVELLTAFATSNNTWGLPSGFTLSQNASALAALQSLAQRMTSSLAQQVDLAFVAAPDATQPGRAADLVFSVATWPDNDGACPPGCVGVVRAATANGTRHVVMLTDDLTDHAGTFGQLLGEALGLAGGDISGWMTQPGAGCPLVNGLQPEALGALRALYGIRTGGLVPGFLSAPQGALAPTWAVFGFENQTGGVLLPSPSYILPWVGPDLFGPANSSTILSLADDGRAPNRIGNDIFVLAPGSRPTGASLEMNAIGGGTIYGTERNETLVAGSHGDTLVTGGGGDEVVLGSGADTVVLPLDGSQVSVYYFDPSADTLAVLGGSSRQSAAAVSGGLRLDLDNATSVFFPGASVAPQAVDNVTLVYNGPCRAPTLAFPPAAPPASRVGEAVGISLGAAGLLLAGVLGAWGWRRSRRPRTAATAVASP